MTPRRRAAEPVLDETATILRSVADQRDRTADVDVCRLSNGVVAVDAVAGVDQRRADVRVGAAGQKGSAGRRRRESLIAGFGRLWPVRD